MIKELEKIIKTAQAVNINITQSFYLWSVKEKVSLNFNISRNDLKFLMVLGVIKNNELTDLGEDLLNEIEKMCDSSLKVNEKLPKLNSQTAELVKRLAVHFLSNRLTDKEVERMSGYVKNNLQIPFYFMFFEMFPTSDSVKNGPWDKHFGTTWDNVTLRRITEGTIKKLNQIWKTKDFGIFLLGTHMFIEQSYNENSNKYFIKSIENYLKEYKHWYEIAEDSLSQGKLDHLLNNSNKSTSNTFIL